MPGQVDLLDRVPALRGQCWGEGEVGVEGAEVEEVVAVERVDQFGIAGFSYQFVTISPLQQLPRFGLHSSAALEQRQESLLAKIRFLQ